MSTVRPPPLFRAATLLPTATVREAMLSLEKSAVGIVLVVGDDDRLLGTLTDGDVRRALLTGANLDSPIFPAMRTQFRAVAPSAGRAEVLDLMQALRLKQVPVIDRDGRVIGLHLIEELSLAKERPNWALVFAGGKGTRLAPLTESLPKPMIRVAGRPILERILLNLLGAGFRRVFFAVNYLAGMIEEHFGDGERFGCSIEYLREDRVLGTGGALALLPKTISRPIAVMNGDLVTQIDVGSMIDAHVAGGQVATIATRRYVHTVPFGCLSLDGDRVLSIDEKPTLAQTINAGLYVLDPEVVARVPLEEIGLPTILQGCVARGDLVRSFEVNDDWIDVGQHEQLRRARGEQGT